jgi:hypothetical protein
VDSCYFSEKRKTVALLLPEALGGRRERRKNEEEVARCRQWREEM